MLDHLGLTLEAQPEQLLADSGYRRDADFIDLESRGIDAYISLGKEGTPAGQFDGEKYPATQRMLAKLATPEGRERYRDRKHIVEAANGWIKRVLGFRQFSLRGLRGASGEWDLVCMALNIRRMKPLMLIQ